MSCATVVVADAALFVDIASTCIGMHMTAHDHVYLKLLQQLLQGIPQMLCKCCKTENLFEWDYDKSLQRPMCLHQCAG